MVGGHSDHVYKVGGGLIFERNEDFHHRASDTDLIELAERVPPETHSDPLPDPTRAEHEDLAVAPNTHRGRVLDAYARMPDGLTDEAACILAGLPSRSTPWKRCVELRRAGYIAPTGEMGWTKSKVQARVCAITERGWVKVREW